MGTCYMYMHGLHETLDWIVFFLCMSVYNRAHVTCVCRFPFLISSRHTQQHNLVFVFDTHMKTIIWLWLTSIEMPRSNHKIVNDCCLSFNSIQNDSFSLLVVCSFFFFSFTYTHFHDFHCHQIRRHMENMAHFLRFIWHSFFSCPAFSSCSPSSCRVCVTLRFVSTYIDVTA